MNKSARIYRLYTEDKNASEISQLVRDHLHAATLLFGKGYFRGEFETCLIIEVISSVYPSVNELIELRIAMVRLARAIQALNKQHEVHLTIQDIHKEVIQ